jgi:hypothetical protein
MLTVSGTKRVKKNSPKKEGSVMIGWRSRFSGESCNKMKILVQMTYSHAVPAEMEQIFLRIDFISKR